MEVAFTLEELWFIQLLVRETDQLGNEWDKEQELKIHAGILALQGRPPETVEPVDFDEDFLWQIENQVPQTLDLGRSNLGRSILLKTFAALQAIEEEKNYEEPIPDVFRNAYPDEDCTVSDDHPGETSIPWGDLPRSAANPPREDPAGAITDEY